MLHPLYQSSHFDNIAYTISIHAFHKYAPMHLHVHPRTFPRVSSQKSAANSKHKKPTNTLSTATSKAPHISMFAGKPVRHAPPFVPGQSNRCCQKHWPARLESCTLDRCTSAILWSPNYHKKRAGNVLNLWGRTFSSFLFAFAIDHVAALSLAVLAKINPEPLTIREEVPWS